MNTLKGNVERARLQRGKPHPTVQGEGTEENEEKEREHCKIECAEYEWGSDISHLLQFLPNNPGLGFDIVIMSDLLHFDSSHTALVDSLTALLSKSGGSRLYVAAGKYTKQDVCDRFIDQACRAGIILVEESYQQVSWRGKMVVRGPGLDREGLKRRRDTSRLWVGRWMDRMTE
ncbi:hypothetical protein BDM02DRAFT_3107617 [Thelephora ganbajun]|uniref:Uncharacterized protein n=1 Tax=Thelephora ganbajun TaxID=370292 RepID=A0ACB6ZW88_THEGA|nr:hypothetical protein BDM02DRAFT_3107617 [Thelephora ganbajun]